MVWKFGHCGLRRRDWRVGRGIGDEEDGGAGSAEGYTVDAGGSGEWQQQGEERADGGAVGLVDAVLHGGAEEVGAAMSEGGDEQSGALHVGDGVGTAVGFGQQGAGLLGGEAGGGNDEEELPVGARRRGEEAVAMISASDRSAETVMPPSQQAATLSGWPSRRQASSRHW